MADNKIQESRKAIYLLSGQELRVYLEKNQDNELFEYDTRELEHLTKNKAAGDSYLIEHAKRNGAENTFKVVAERGFIPGEKFVKTVVLQTDGLLKGLFKISPKYPLPTDSSIIMINTRCIRNLIVYLDTSRKMLKPELVNVIIDTLPIDEIISCIKEYPDVFSSIEFQVMFLESKKCTELIQSIVPLMKNWHLAVLKSLDISESTISSGDTDSSVLNRVLKHPLGPMALSLAFADSKGAVTIKDRYREIKICRFETFADAKKGLGDDLYTNPILFTQPDSIPTDSLEEIRNNRHLIMDSIKTISRSKLLSVLEILIKERCLHMLFTRSRFSICSDDHYSSYRSHSDTDQIASLLGIVCDNFEITEDIGKAILSNVSRYSLVPFILRRPEHKIAKLVPVIYANAHAIVKSYLTRSLPREYMSDLAKKAKKDVNFEGFYTKLVHTTPDSKIELPSSYSIKQFIIDAEKKKNLKFICSLPRYEVVVLLRSFPIEDVEFILNNSVILRSRAKTNSNDGFAKTVFQLGLFKKLHIGAGQYQNDDILPMLAQDDSYRSGEHLMECDAFTLREMLEHKEAHPYFVNMNTWFKPDADNHYYASIYDRAIELGFLEKSAQSDAVKESDDSDYIIVGINTKNKKDEYIYDNSAFSLMIAKSFLSKWDHTGAISNASVRSPQLAKDLVAAYFEKDSDKFKKKFIEAFSNNGFDSEFVKERSGISDYRRRARSLSDYDTVVAKDKLLEEAQLLFSTEQVTLNVKQLSNLFCKDMLESTRGIIAASACKEIFIGEGLSPHDNKADLIIEMSKVTRARIEVADGYPMEFSVLKNHHNINAVCSIRNMDDTELSSVEDLMNIKSFVMTINSFAKLKGRIYLPIEFIRNYYCTDGCIKNEEELIVLLERFGFQGDEDFLTRSELYNCALSIDSPSEKLKQVVRRKLGVNLVNTKNILQKDHYISRVIEFAISQFDSKEQDQIDLHPELSIVDKSNLIKYLSEVVHPDYLELLSTDLSSLSSIPTIGRIKSNFVKADEDIMRELRIPKERLNNKKLLKTIVEMARFDDIRNFSNIIKFYGICESVGIADANINDVFDFSGELVTNKIQASPSSSAVEYLSTGVVKNAGLFKTRARKDIIHFVKTLSDDHIVVDAIKGVVESEEILATINNKISTMMNVESIPEEAQAKRNALIKKLQMAVIAGQKRVEEIKEITDVDMMHDRVVSLLAFLQSQNNENDVEFDMIRHFSALSKDNKIIDTGWKVFIPQFNSELVELGHLNGWCVKSTNTYRDSVIHKESLMLGLVPSTEEAIIDNVKVLVQLSLAQGEYYVSQAKFKNNAPAERSIDFAPLLKKANELYTLKKSKPLREAA